MCLAILVAGSADSQAAEPTTASLLSRLARYAELYRSSALEFSCHESIVYKPSGPGGTSLDLEYIYVNTPGAGLTDYRTLRGGKPGSEESRREVDVAIYGVPAFVQRAYSWIFLFERSRWGLHRYEIAGRDQVGSRGAAILAFEPIKPCRPEVNDWYGQAWIDLETGHLLKVEALQCAQHELRERLQAELQSAEPIPKEMPRDYDISKVTTEFNIEKNGLMFPGLAIIERSRSTLLAREGRRAADVRHVFTVRQEYSKYRFFSIKTLDEVQSYVLKD